MIFHHVRIFPWPVSRECYRRSLAVSRTTISYSVYVVILGVCLRFKPHWMLQIYKYVIKGREELTSCSSLMHSYLFPLLDVLYRQVGNLSFWTVSCTEFRHGGQWSYSGSHSGSWEHNDISVRFRAYISIWSIITADTRKLYCEPAVKCCLIGRSWNA